MSNQTRKIKVEGKEITLFVENDNDFISLTDILKSKDGDFFISDWLRNRNTLEFLGAWEQLNNPDFNYGEFATIKNQSGLNNYKISIKEHIIPKLTKKDIKFVYPSEADILNKALFGMTASEWKEKNPDKKGNMRDTADVYQLVCLANLETHNAEFIEQGLTQAERIYKLNTIAIRQMKSLTTNIQVKSLEQKSKKMIESKEEGI
jgi:hypothetical protein